MRICAVLICFGTLLLSPCRAAEVPSGKVWFHEDFTNGLSSGWKPVKFTGLTDYKVVQEGTNFFVQGHANKTASGLAHELKIKPGAHLKIQWRWKIDHCPAGASDDKKDTFDHTARIFVAFDTFIGPTRTINYVWANQKKIDDTFHHPSSDRARFIVLQSGDERAGQWLTETRDLTADWQRLFDNSKVPDIVGIGFMTDADGTQTDVTGYYSDFRLFTE